MSSQNMLINKKIKIISAVVLALVLVLIIVWQKNKNQPKDAINTKSEVVKSADEVNQITTDSISQKEKIQVRFSWEVDGIKYNDALYFTPAEYAKLSPQDIKKMEQERFDNWMKTVNTQSKQ